MKKKVKTTPKTKEPKQNNRTIMIILTIAFIVLFALGILEKNRVMSIAGIMLTAITLFYWTEMFKNK